MLLEWRKVFYEIFVYLNEIYFVCCPFFRYCSPAILCLARPYITSQFTVSLIQFENAHIISLIKEEYLAYYIDIVSDGIIERCVRDMRIKIKKNFFASFFLGYGDVLYTIKHIRYTIRRNSECVWYSVYRCGKDNKSVTTTTEKNSGTWKR